MQTPNLRNGSAAEPGGTGRGAKAQASGQERKQHSTTVHLTPAPAGSRMRTVVFARLGPRLGRYQRAVLIVTAGVDAARALTDATGCPVAAAFAPDEVEPVAQAMFNAHPRAVVVVGALYEP